MRNDIGTLVRQFEAIVREEKEKIAYKRSEAMGISPYGDSAKLGLTRRLTKEGFRTIVERMAARLVQLDLHTAPEAQTAFLDFAQKTVVELVGDRNPALWGDAHASSPRQEPRKMREEMMQDANDALEKARHRIVGDQLLKAEPMSQNNTFNVKGNAAVVMGDGVAQAASDDARQQAQVQQADLDSLQLILKDILARLPAVAEDTDSIRVKVADVETAAKTRSPSLLRTIAKDLWGAIGKFRDGGLVELGKRLAEWLAGPPPSA